MKPIRKAVIPAAGFGARFLPFARAVLAKVSGLLRRFDPFPDPERPLFRPAPAELIIWLLFAGVTFLMVYYHEPWRDEAQGYVLVRDTTLPELIRHMPRESQFLLWYFLTWLLVHLCGFTIFGLNVLHWALSCCTAFLVLRRAPFRLLTRAALIFAVLFAFEFTVVTRHYAIGIFLLAVLMVNWRQRFRRPVLYACGIAVCASTNLPVWVCLGGLCISIAYEANVRRLYTPQVIIAVLVVILGYLLAMLEIYNGAGFGSPYVSYRGDQVAGFDLAKQLENMSDSISNLVHLPVWLYLVCVIACGLYLAWKSIPALECFLTSFFLMFSLQFIGGFHSMRHTGFVLLGIVVSCWIAAEDETAPSGYLSRLPKRAAACIAFIAGSAAALVLFLQCFLTPFFVWMEVKYPFSHGRAASVFIRDNIPEDVPMFCFTARSNVSVLPWLPGREYFIFDRMEKGTYSKWGRAFGLSMEGMSVAAASRLQPEHRYGVFVVAMNELPTIFPPNMILLYDSRENEQRTWGPYVEEFLVFAVVRKEDTDLYRPRFPRIHRPYMPDGL